MPHLRVDETSYNANYIFLALGLMRWYEDGTPFAKWSET